MKKIKLNEVPPVKESDTTFIFVGVEVNWASPCGFCMKGQWVMHGISSSSLPLLQITTNH